MIVDDKKVEIALDYLNADPAPVAIARKEVNDAENKCKQVWAHAFLKASGSVDARKAEAEIDPDYMQAREEHSEAVARLENEKARCNGATMLIEAWRTEQSNIRAAERIR